MNCNFTLKHSFKSLTLSVAVLMFSFTLNAQEIIRVTSVDTDSDEIVLTNLGSTTFDVGVYWLCLGPSTYQQVSNAALTNTNLAPGESATVSYDADPVADGFSLFSTNNFQSSDPSILVDYIQWGAGGQPRVDQAVTAGRWDDIENFVSGSSPYTFSGGAEDFGSTFWDASLSTEDSFESRVSIFPIPATDDLTIQVPNESKFDLYIEIYDISGRKVVGQSINGGLNNLINVRDLQSGVYLLNINDSSEVLMSRKVLVQ